MVQLDAARLIAANSVDPMISVATVPEFQQMTTGGLVATIKIISYGVPQSKLSRPVIWHATVFDFRTKFAPADSIFSDTDGGAGDKGKEAIAARLDMLGVTLNSVQMVPHDAESIATATITTSQADLVMILSGSATSDWADVAPTAVSQAGGNASKQCPYPEIYCSLAASDQNP